ncbi:MAG: Nif3-like dinuclear metal center hexameric protein [Gammaproteobacteria bacterium]|nr:Nif3-like dinuclear metal center hexameric protein [Gammaproteobacteria bacterium]
MPMTLSALTDYLDRLLDAGRFADYAPNGLQVEGRAEVRRILGGVSASHALVEQALDWGADAILVHHGWFWRNEDPRVCGIKRRRLHALLCGDLSLIAYHLPLDAHAEFGNNVQLARVLDIEITGSLDTGRGESGLLLRGRLPVAVSGQQLGRHLAQRLAREPLYVAGARPLVRDVAWSTGAAQDYLEHAAAAGVDAFITGEASERTTHLARESGVHFYAAGHHATERYGVRALLEHIGAKFDVETRFVDIDNPV